MSTAFGETSAFDRVAWSTNFHFQNLLFVVRRFSGWVLLVPLNSMCLIVLDSRTGFGWFAEKATQEIIAPSILALTASIAMLFWARAGHFYSRWLVLTSGALFCRELHFWGTNNGIYLVIPLLLWYASRNMEGMRPFVESRLAVSLFGGALMTYGLTKTFDRAYWTFLGGWKDWQDTMEESLESTAHLLILSLVVASYFSWGRAFRCGIAQQTSFARRLKVWTGLSAAVAGAALSFGHWFGEEEKPVRTMGGFPIELSSLCNVNPDLCEPGRSLFLASSDEEHKLTLWTFNDENKPTFLKYLELNVPLDDGSFYHLDDLEDLSWDGRDTYYAVSSHRHIVPQEDAARLAKSHGTECALVSFQLAKADDDIAVINARSVTRDLLPKIRKLGVFPSIDWSNSKAFMWRGFSKSFQLDIEGLAYVDGKLLLGFKNPIESGRATILSFDPKTEELSVAARPDLGGQGILALHYELAIDRLCLLSNNSLKHRYGDSCLWVGTRGSDAGNPWEFAASNKFIVEPHTAKKLRKASGLTIHDDKVAICFDSESESPIQVIALDKVLPRF